MRNRDVHRAPIWKISRAMPKTDPKAYYTCLGVDPFATADQIRAAYHRCAKQWHPDLDPSPGAQARFQAISEAYQTLSSPRRRTAYDRSRWAAAVEGHKLASVRWRRTERDGSSPALGRLGLPALAGALGLVSLALLF
jgi:curved DNA-binding protein CbpA